MSAQVVGWSASPSNFISRQWVCVNISLVEYSFLVTMKILILSLIEKALLAVICLNENVAASAFILRLMLLLW
jgi:hypothetical protein